MKIIIFIGKWLILGIDRLRQTGEYWPNGAVAIVSFSIFSGLAAMVTLMQYDLAPKLIYTRFLVLFGGWIPSIAILVLLFYSFGGHLLWYIYKLHTRH